MFKRIREKLKMSWRETRYLYRAVWSRRMRRARAARTWAGSLPRRTWARVWGIVAWSFQKAAARYTLWRKPQRSSTVRNRRSRNRNVGMLVALVVVIVVVSVLSLDRATARVSFGTIVGWLAAIAVIGLVGWLLVQVATKPEWRQSNYLKPIVEIATAAALLAVAVWGVHRLVAAADLQAANINAHYADEARAAKTLCEADPWKEGCTTEKMYDKVVYPGQLLSEPIPEGFRLSAWGDCDKLVNRLQDGDKFLTSVWALKPGADSARIRFHLYRPHSPKPELTCDWDRNGYGHQKDPPADPPITPVAPAKPRNAIASRGFFFT